MQQRILERKEQMWKSAISFGNGKLPMMHFVKTALTKGWKQKPNYRGLKRFLTRKFYLVIDSKNERKQQLCNQVSRKEVRIIAHLVNGGHGVKRSIILARLCFPVWP